MKNTSFLSSVFTLLICSYSSVAHSQNIALNKPYTYSAAPNYALASSDDNHTLLTDGIYTTTYFWTTKTTVGWQYRKRLNIEIDLLQPSAIDKVSFNTVRGAAGVEFPANIFVFTSTDKKIFTYAGDAAVDPDNVPGAYEVKKFTLSGINRTARYVQLVIIPNGVFIFCDEVEVIAGNNTHNDNLKNAIGITNVNSAADSVIKRKSNIKKMSYEIVRMKSSINQSGSNDDPETMARTAKESDIISNLNKVKASRVSNLKATFNGDVIIDKVNPWEALSFPYKPRGTNNNIYNIVTTVSGVQYGAFVITNSSGNDMTFDCKFDGPSGNTSNELFTVPFVTSGKTYSETADPLIPCNQSIKLESGESRVFFFKITGKTPGPVKSAIKIQSGSFAARLSININVLTKGSPNGYYAINTDNWAYLTYPLLSDRQDAAVNDLLAHHINTMIVPPFSLPVVGNPDYKAFVKYVTKLKSFHNIFLFMDLTSKAYQDSFKQDAFMSDAWQAKFLSWYSGIVQNAQSVGISPSQIFLYPFDEAQGNNLVLASNFLNWLKSNHPDIKTFATLTTKPAIDALRPLVTIPQIVNNNDLLRDAQSNKDNGIWLYQAQSNAELLSPYSYYRLLAWNAFYSDYVGIGFWNYADYENGSTGKVNVDDFDGVNGTNYSVIYDGPDKTLISSRRWEAFRLGIEDYELLKMYAEKNGLTKTKQLAKVVIDNPTDLSKADIIRNQMLQSLSN